MADRLGILFGIFVVAASLAADAADVVSGPVEAAVVRVVDGDTLEVDARIWLGQNLRIRVRIKGIDAPELRGKCRYERAAAAAARDALIAAIGGRPVTLHGIQYGKFAGRVVATVRGPDGENLGDQLLAAGLARRYDGKRRAPWCDEAQARGNP